MTICVCSHPGAVHQHYRHGTDCGLCDCPRYRQAYFWWWVSLVVLVALVLTLVALVVVVA
jgi:hypothetical protein